MANITGTPNDDNLAGGAGSDLILGLDGNDTLDGGAGADVLEGGRGDDLYIVDDPGDFIIEDTGHDTVQSLISFSLRDKVEDLTLTGGADIDGTGNKLDNTLTGNTGANTLDGQTGNDVLVGGDGDDVLIGDKGSDTMSGGIGDDVVFVDSKNDVLHENPLEGTDSVITTISMTLPDNFEFLRLTGKSGIDGIGNDLDNFITGNTGNNKLVGGLGNDELDGGVGADTMIGGAGDDSYLVDNVKDVITEFAGEGTDAVLSKVDYVLPAEVENLELSGIVAIRGTGNALSNLIEGTDGDNTLDGGGGVDILAGGLGNDSYIVDTTTDLLLEAPGAGTDAVFSSVSFDLSAVLNIENLTLTGANAVNATGDAGDNVITGNAAANILAGGDGNDTYFVGTGDTIVEVAGQGNDTVMSAITWTLDPEVENLILTGKSAINGTGNTGDNVLTGNSAANTLDGGLGNDTYIIDAKDTIVDAGGTDTVMANFTYTLTSVTENLTLTGIANINGTGNASDNVITGNSGNNTLNGGLGNDVLVGGQGNDTYIIDSAGKAITENANEGTDIVLASVSYILDANVDNITLTGLNNINATGNSGDNVLTGNAGANGLDGGLGNDTYVIDALDTVAADAGGTDTVVAGFSYDISARPDLENITLTGAASLNATGNGNDNVLTGNSGANVLNGGLGDDTYVIDKNDVVLDAGGTDTIVANFSDSLAANFENLTLTGKSALHGIGNASANIIIGNDGNNLLDGMGGGLDTLEGGKGNDTYLVHNTLDVIVEHPGEGIDTVKSEVTYALSPDVENLLLTGHADINGTGNGEINKITGNSGANVLDGGAGADLLDGGSGNDTYVVDDAGDAIKDSGGVDSVFSAIDFILPNNIENLTITDASGHMGTGNKHDNIITGGAGGDTLLGLDGNDTIIGGDGDDSIDGGQGHDIMVGGLGNDIYFVDSAADVVIEDPIANTADLIISSVSYTLPDNVENLEFSGDKDLNGFGSLSSDNLHGNEGKNILDGGGGADREFGFGGNDILRGGDNNDELYGGDGQDTMTGGLGPDTFIFEADSAFNDVDIITDYSTFDGVSPGIGDAIDVKDLLTGYHAGTDALSDFVRFVPHGNAEYLEVDADGAANGAAFVRIANLLNTTGLPDVDTLVANGNLIVS